MENKDKGNSFYRPDIDGLRALSVLAVFFFHLFPELLPGGFVGVDFFFVISGFLITKIILRELEKKQGDFSFWNFYARRSKRILPSLFFVLIVTGGFAYLSLASSDFSRYLESSNYAAFQLSNFLFAKTTNYFAESSTELLLHTWSLAVEEQFYLFWPLLLFFSYKIGGKKGSFIALLLLFLSSLALSEFWVRSKASLAFYMFPSRAWEFCVGAFLSYSYLPSLKSKLGNSILSLTGLVLSILAIAISSKNIPFPGLFALLPCLAVALLIYTGETSKSFVTKFFSLDFMAAIGRLSYPMYLWHWPAIEVYKYVWGVKHLNAFEAIIIFVVTYILSLFSFHFIEAPIRYTKDIKNILFFLPKFFWPSTEDKRSIAISVYFMILISLGNQALKSTENSSFRISAIDVEGEARLEIDESHNCIPRSKEKLGYFDCVVGEGRSKKALLFGDSHTRHYYVALQKWAKEKDVEIQVFSLNNCPSLFGNFIVTDEKANDVKANCQSFRDNVKSYVEQLKTLDYVFLSSRFALYVEEKEISRFSFQRRISTGLVSVSVQKSRENFKKLFRSTLSFLKTKTDKIIVLAQIPTLYDSPHFCMQANSSLLARAFTQRPKKIDDCFQFDLALNDKQSAWVNQYFSQNSQELGLKVFFPISVVNSAQSKEGGLYFDENHMNHRGAKILGFALSEFLLENFSD